MGAPCSPGERGPNKPGAARTIVFNEQIAVGHRAKALGKVVFGTTYAGANVGHHRGRLGV
jgi:hypothetical protein